MESDRKTRVFYTSGTTFTGKQPIREVYPQPQPKSEEMIGEESDDVFRRSDFDVVGSADPNTGEEVWSVTQRIGRKRFEIPRLNRDLLQEYRRIAEELEQRTGIKGLTITVS